MRIRRGQSWGWVMMVAVVTSGAPTTLDGCATRPPVTQTADALREVELTRWLSGPDGMHVEVVDFADQSSLVRILGVQSELTGKVFAYQRVLNGERLEYQTKWHGGDLYAVVKERDGGWRAYIPGVPNGRDLTYSEQKSAEVDAAAIQRLHQEQTRSGELAALQRFDRAAAQRHSEEELASSSESTANACGKAVPLAVAWKSVTDEQLLEKSVSGYCESLLSALKHLCDDEAGKRFVQRVNAAECTLDGDDSLQLSGDKLRWAINFDITNADQRAYAALRAIKPEGARYTLDEQILRERTAVCADAAQKHVVLVGPREAAHRGMAYGDGKKFSWIRTPQVMSDGWFFDPRQRNDKHNENFRGLDLRLFSYVEPDLKAKSCKLSCGTRETSLKLLEGEAKDSVLDGATYEDSPHRREPHALARDKAGVYYYVDRGVTEATARDFRLYRGPRGKLRPLPMKDVVSDSEGEIFASTSGKLRLVLDKQSAQWIAGSTLNLLLLPLEQNYGLIYNELGVYLSERLGVPCDDM